MAKSIELSTERISGDELSLLSLPSETHLNLLYYLDYESQLDLRSVNHYFYRLVAVVHGDKYRQATELLLGEYHRAMCLKTSGNMVRLDSGRRRLEERLALHLELRSLKPVGINYSRWDMVMLGFYPCYTCIQWLPYDRFSQSLTRTDYVLGGLHCAARTCMQCGIDIGIYMKSGTGVQDRLLKAYNHCQRRGCKTVFGPRWEAGTDETIKHCERCMPRQQALRRKTKTKHETQHASAVYKKSSRALNADAAMGI